MFVLSKHCCNDKAGECKACKKIYEAIFYQKNKKRILAKLHARRKIEQAIRKTNWKPYCVPLKKCCAKCAKEKKLEEYHRSSRSKDGRNSWCISCIAEYMKSFRQVEKNKIAIAARQKKYRFSNIKKLKSYHKIYDAAHSRENVERAKQWRINNPKRYNKWSRKALSIGRMQLSDIYIKNVLTANTILCFADIPQELVDAKCEHLKLKRALKALT